MGAGRGGPQCGLEAVFPVSLDPVVGDQCKSSLTLPKMKPTAFRLQGLWSRVFVHEYPYGYSQLSAVSLLSRLDARTDSAETQVVH